MEREEFERLYRLEDTHWWFDGRRSVARKLLAPVALPVNPAPVLDLGCGTGATLDFLTEFGSPVGLDLSSAALGRCRQRRQRAITQGTVEQLPFGDESFYLLTVFDLLYHRQVRDDRAALRECCRVCKHGGYLLAIEPALDWLWSGHDLIHHSRHRYTTHELRDSMSSAGFVVQKASYINTLLFPLVCAVRLTNRLRRPDRPSSDLTPVPRTLNRLLSAVFGWEGALVRRANLPVGSSAACLGRKP